MRQFLYGVATFCGFIALILLIVPIIGSLGNLRGGPDAIASLIVLSLSLRLAPFALALAVIPLCIAFAYDKMTEWP